MKPQPLHFHEAGHAVVDHVLGAHVEFVKLGNGRGVVRAPFDDPRLAIIATVAGGIAESLAFPHSNPEHEDEDAAKECNLAALMSVDDPREAAKIRASARISATALLHANWPAVEAVAQRLAEQRDGRLEGYRVPRIIEHAMSQPDPHAEARIREAAKILTHRQTTTTFTEENCGFVVQQGVRR